MLLQLDQCIWGNSVFWFNAFSYLKMQRQGLWSSDQVSGQNPNGWEKSVPLAILGMGLHLKAGVGTPLCKMENLIFHFHGIQGFKINIGCKPHPTHKSVLFPFSLLLSLACMLRSLLPLYHHMLCIWESHGHGTEIKEIGSSELPLELVLNNAIPRILSQWYLQTLFNN